MTESASSNLENLRHSQFDKIFSFPMVLVAIFALIVSYFIPQSVADPDIWWHLRNAQYQLQTHTFISHDMYSFTARNAPWMNHEWLAELPFYLGWRLAGMRGLYLISVIAIELNLLGIFYLAYRKSRNFYSAFFVSLLGIVLATVSFGPRTLLFGWICLILELIIFDHFQRNQQAIWALPILFVIWVNTHGSWIIGIVLLLIFTLSGSFVLRVHGIHSELWSLNQLKSLCLSTIVSIAGLFLNPYGWRLVFYPFNLAFRQQLNIANIEEWRTLDFHSPRGRIFLTSLALLFIVQVMRNRQWIVYELIFFFVGVYASFSYTRFLFLAAILCVPIMSRAVPDFFTSGRRPDKPLLNLTILFTVMLLLVFRLSHSIITTSGEKKFPSAVATEYLHQFHPDGNVFNEYLWGGYLVWNARQIPVLVDSRVDIFEYNGTFKDYLDAVRLNNTLAIFDKYNIRYVLFERDTPLVYFLENTSMWKVDYSNQNLVVLERNHAP